MAAGCKFPDAVEAWLLPIDQNEQKLGKIRGGFAPMASAVTPASWGFSERWPPAGVRTGHDAQHTRDRTRLP